MDDYAVQDVDVSNPQLVDSYTHNSVSVGSDSKVMGEIQTAMEILTRVDLDLAYSSEKLANLDKLLMQVLACENDLEAMVLDNGNISNDIIEKSFVFSFLSTFLDSEVKELNYFMGSLKEVIIHARPKISDFRVSTDLFEIMEAKLHDSEDLLKQSLEQISDIGMQSTKLAKTLFPFEHNDLMNDEGTSSSEYGLVNTDEEPKMHAVKQKRHILRMLEKSLGRELDLEKKLSESQQNEEDMKLKQRLTEQVAFAMEEAAEAVWGRLLEAENAKEVLTSISKEMLNRFQILQFNLNGSMQREDEAKWKLIKYTEQLNARESALQKLEDSVSVLNTDNLEVFSLREKVKLLEENVKETDSRLKNANALIEENEENILEMENIIDSLKENIYIADNRADAAEAKVNELTETNSEINEELNFLKTTNETNTKKVSVIEKQLRECEIQLQHARASSEASQEQQNMLYSAIWDMETLIEELKSKVAKAEMKTENSEEQCVLLSETNLEMNKEVSSLRSKVESLEEFLERANDAKRDNANDVNVKTKVIMDMVLQLAMERERIQKQMLALTEANKVLVDKLQKSNRYTSASVHDNGSADTESLPSYDKVLNRNDTNGVVPENVSGEIISRTFQQVDGSSKDTNLCEANLGSLVSEHETEAATNEEEMSGHNDIYIYIPVIVLLLSLVALYIFNQKISLIEAGI